MLPAVCECPAPVMATKTEVINDRRLCPNIMLGHVTAGSSSVMNAAGVTCLCLFAKIDFTLLKGGLTGVLHIIRVLFLRTSKVTLQVGI